MYIYYKITLALTLQLHSALHPCAVLLVFIRKKREMGEIFDLPISYASYMQINVPTLPIADRSRCSAVKKKKKRRRTNAGMCNCNWPTITFFIIHIAVCAWEEPLTI